MRVPAFPTKDLVLLFLPISRVLRTFRISAFRNLFYNTSDNLRITTEMIHTYTRAHSEGI